MASISKAKDKKWRVLWRTPQGKQKTKTFALKTQAKAFKAKVELELAQSTYMDVQAMSWEEFTKGFFDNDVSNLRPSTQMDYRIAVRHVERILAPRTPACLDAAAISRFAAKRLKERGARVGDTVSPATVNGNLRVIKKLLNVAKDWSLIREVPRIKMLREPEKIKPFVTEEHFGLIYEACGAATRPTGLPFPPDQWWRAFLTFTYLTGWRVGEPIKLLRADVDLDAGLAITRHGDNKGRRDEVMPLHPEVIEHLRGMTSFREELFPWDYDRRTLYTEFHRIQTAAGIHLECRKKHEHTDACHLYGFHALRRAFATVVAQDLSANDLRAVMRHKSISTTMRYINARERLSGVVAKYRVATRRKAN